MADEDRIGQVLQNLLSNAIKYSPPGTEIRISGQVRPQHIVVCVSDQGSGIAPDDIRISSIDFIAPLKQPEKQKGWIGFVSRRAIIEAHQGRIWVDPKPGDGARICFSLPRT